MDGTTPNQPQQPTINQSQNQQPQQAQGPTPDAAAIEQAVLQKVFGGKYLNADEAARGYWELNQSAANAVRMLEERANPAALAAQRPDPFQRLEKESYIPQDALREAIRAEASHLVQEAFKPVAGALTARDRLAAEFPAYIENETAINGWLRNNPQIAAEVQELGNSGHYVAAAKLATFHWRQANPPASQGNVEQKQQAALQTGNVNTGRQVDPGQNADIMAQAIQYGHRTGDKRPAYTMLFPDFEPILPPHMQQR